MYGIWHTCASVTKKKASQWGLLCLSRLRMDVYMCLSVILIGVVSADGYVYVFKCHINRRC
jgi:hypothetical protein